jgi:hypothetical protein
MCATSKPDHRPTVPGPIVSPEFETGLAILIEGIWFAQDSPLEGGGFEPSVPWEGELHLCPFSSNSKSGQTTSHPEDLAKVLRGP